MPRMKGHLLNPNPGNDSSNGWSRADGVLDVISTLFELGLELLSALAI